MGGCQNYGPFLGTLNIRGRIIIGTQKGTIILTTSHIIYYTKELHGRAWVMCHKMSCARLWFGETRMREAMPAQPKTS